MEDVLECCTICGFSSKQGCNGGYMEGAFNWVQKTGVCTGDQPGSTSLCKNYFLSPSSNAKPAPACKKSCDATSSVTSYASNLYKTLGYKSLVGATISQTVINAQNAIMSRGSIVAAFDVYDDFFSYQKGVYVQTSGINEGGHAVRVVGWGVDSVSKLPYWIVANSWGTGWGIKGWFWMVRGTNNCNFEAEMIEGVMQ
jgi:cathepsin B